MRDTFSGLPDPGEAGTLAELIERLRALKIWAGDPSYETISARINTAWKAAGRPEGERAHRATIADCFHPKRRRLNADLLVAVVRALHPDRGYVTQWELALRVVAGNARAAAQVRVAATLPADLSTFTGRAAELEVLDRALRSGTAPVVATIEGMAGIGKTRLAVHAAHRVPADRVLFVDLRGFHPDPAQPPADPDAVLDGFLRLLGMAAQRIPHGLAARTAAYRSLLTGTRTLVVLDNAATAEQVRPLLPRVRGCPVLITSRRDLSALRPTTRLVVDPFTRDEAVELITRAAVGVAVGTDDEAVDRIARRCGHLPLALGLVAANLRTAPGWTLTDHAERLDEHHRRQRLDSGVQLAFGLSYQRLTAVQQRLLRLAALHPGQDFDTYAAAALTGSTQAAAAGNLRRLCQDHLLYESAGDRFFFHDLVRVYAADRATDEDPATERRAALTRLFDHYLATAGAAMDVLHPAEAERRPRIPPPGTDLPALTDRPSAAAWLDAERPALLAVTAHAAAHGWPSHATRMSAILYRYLAGGFHAEALIVHGHAHRAARGAGDIAGEAAALAFLGGAYLQTGQFDEAAEHLGQAQKLYRRTGDPAGEARALNNLGIVESALGHYGVALDHHENALTLYGQVGDRLGEARCLTNLGNAESRMGRYQAARSHHDRALALYRESGDQYGEAVALNDLGGLETGQGRYAEADDHLGRSLDLFGQLGVRTGQAWAHDNLGALRRLLGRTDEALDHHRLALEIYRETGDLEGEAWVLNNLGEAARATGRDADALTHYEGARTIADEIGSRLQLARAHTGLGRACHALGRTADAREHYAVALSLYAELGLPEAEELRSELGAL